MIKMNIDSLEVYVMCEKIKHIKVKTCSFGYVKHLLDDQVIY